MSCRVRICRTTLIFGFALSLATCSRTADPGVSRIAIIAFENLSGDPDLGWVGTAVAAVAAARSGAADRLNVFESASLRDAQSRFATTSFEGYLTGNSKDFTLHGVTRKSDSQSNSAAWTISGHDVLSLANEVATKTGAPLSDYTTSSQEAVEACFRGMTSIDAGAAESSLREAVRLDPQYGTAWLALHDLLVRTNRAAEAQTIFGSSAGARFTTQEKARLAVLTAKEPRLQIEAMMALASLRAGDADAWRQTADRAMSLRLHREAIAAMNELLKLKPGDEQALNLRGYSWIYLGKFDEAREAFAEYRKQLPASANALDSTAEMMFYFRRYADAAKLFMEANEKSPSGLGGAEPFRAAYAEYLAGNLSGADRLFAQYVRDPKDVRYAIWQRWTGRSPGEAPAGLKALWALQDGDRKAAAAFASQARQNPANPALANLAVVATVLSLPHNSADGWRARLQQMIPAPQQQNLRDQLLAWALLLDGHFGEAASQSRFLLERSTRQFDDQPRILLAASLLATGNRTEAKRIMPEGYLPPTALRPSLEALLYPMAADVVKKLH